MIIIQMTTDELDATLTSVIDDLQVGKSCGQTLKKEYILADLPTNEQVKERIFKTILQNK